MEKAKNKVFGGGIPTEMDIDKLKETFGVPEEGTVITYNEITQCIGYHKNSVRFQTVTNRWRNTLFSSHNILMSAVRGVGLKALPPGKRIDVSVGKVRTGNRYITKAASIANRTDRNRLDESGKKTQDFIRQMGASFKLLMISSAKEIAYPIPQIESIWKNTSTKHQEAVAT